MITSFRKVAAVALAALFVAAAATCTVSTTGAPCDSIENCPKNQFCSVEGTCRANQKDAPCETDAHCPGGEYCAEGTCAEGEAPADAGTDGGGTDAGGAVDAGQDAGKVDCAIDANCEMKHVAVGKCVESRCQLTCDKGWVDANKDATDGCEKELGCAATGGFGLYEECTTNTECACGARGANCVKGLYDSFGLVFDRGECLEDCLDNACSEPNAECIETKRDEKGRPIQKSCFKTGKLKGTFTVLVKPTCTDTFGDTRAGLTELILGGANAQFTLFSACRKKDSSNKDTVEVQGFKLCGQVPCQNVFTLYIAPPALDKTEVPFYDAVSGQPNINVIWIEAELNGPALSKMTIHGMGNGGRVYNLSKTNTAGGPEYKGDLDIDMFGYDLAICGGTTGLDCAKLTQ